MTILITGAFGFVGSHLVEFIRKKTPTSTTIVAVGNGKITSEKKGIVCEFTDITDQTAVDHLIIKYKPHCVIHLAARSSVQQSHNASRLTYETNVSGTVVLANAMRKHIPGSAMIFASTGEIYGDAFKSGAALKEDAAVAPGNPYSRSKLAAEIALRDSLSDVCPVIALRLLNHTGVGQDERFVVPSFAAQIARIEAGTVEPIMRVGNLEAERDFLGISDVLEAYHSAVEFSGRAEGFNLFNIASGVPRSIKSILEDLRSMSSISFDVEQDPARLRPSDIARAVGDASAFREVTGWCPKHDWKDTLKSILIAYRKTANSSIVE